MVDLAFLLRKVRTSPNAAAGENSSQNYGYVIAEGATAPGNSQAKRTALAKGTSGKQVVTIAYMTSPKM